MSPHRRGTGKLCRPSMRSPLRSLIEYQRRRQWQLWVGVCLLRHHAAWSIASARRWPRWDRGAVAVPGVRIAVARGHLGVLSWPVTGGAPRSSVERANAASSLSRTRSPSSTEPRAAMTRRRVSASYGAIATVESSSTSLFTLIPRCRAISFSRPWVSSGMRMVSVDTTSWIDGRRPGGRLRRRSGGRHPGGRATRWRSGQARRVVVAGAAQVGPRGGGFTREVAVAQVGGEAQQLRVPGAAFHARLTQGPVLAQRFLDRVSSEHRHHPRPAVRAALRPGPASASAAARISTGVMAVTGACSASAPGVRSR